MKLFNAKRTFLLLILLSVFCTGCKGVLDQSTKSEGNRVETLSKIKIGISMSSLLEDRWIKDRDTMINKCQKLGMESIVQTADLDSSRQAAQCADMISKGVSVLIIIPHDAEKSAEIVKRAHEKGVKVISYDRMILNADVDLYVSFDGTKVGELQGKMLTEAVPKGNYVILSGAPNDDNSGRFLSGAMKYIQPLVDKGDIRVLMKEPVDNWEATNAYQLVQKALSQNQNNIDAVLAPNDATAGGCLKAITESNITKKIFITGQDAEMTAAKRILGGTQLMTVFKDTRKLGIKTIELAQMLAKGEKVEATVTINNKKINVPSFLIEPIGVDKNNLDQELIGSGYLNKESLYSK